MSKGPQRKPLLMHREVFSIGQKVKATLHGKWTGYMQTNENRRHADEVGEIAGFSRFQLLRVRFADGHEIESHMDFWKAA